MKNKMVIMPEELTTDNGAKALLNGEFHETIDIDCPECHGDGCEDCNGQGHGTVKVPVSWATIKQIYAMAVERLSL